jgi:hypothetical protein
VDSSLHVIGSPFLRLKCKSTATCPVTCPNCIRKWIATLSADSNRRDGRAGQLTTALALVHWATWKALSTNGATLQRWWFTWCFGLYRGQVLHEELRICWETACVDPTECIPLGGQQVQPKVPYHLHADDPSESERIRKVADRMGRHHDCVNSPFLPVSYAFERGLSA